MTYMKNSVICDTDFLISLHLENESTHQKAYELFQRHDNFIVLNITFFEMATVLSRKLYQSEAVEILESIQSEFTNVYNLTKQDELSIFELFKSYSKKNISFFDCACLHITQKLDCKIASFDSFYPKEILA